MSLSSLQEVICSLGQPIAGNPMQFIMERAIAAAGLDWRYLSLEVTPEALGDAMRGMRAMGFYGADIAPPHTLAVVPLVDGLDPTAELIGAVNCVRRQDRAAAEARRYLGENTLGRGFVGALKPLVDPAGKHVVVLGSGTTARAIAVELAQAGATEIHVVGRNTDRGQQLADLLSDRLKISAMYFPWSGDYEIPPGVDLVVHATTIGSGDPDARVPLRLESLSPPTVLADAVFNPPRTRLLREANARGLKTLDGLEIFVGKAAESFQAWTGREADRALIREALEEFFEV